MSINIDNSRTQVTLAATNQAINAGFYVFLETDLKVVKTNPTTLVDTVLTLNTHYTVTNEGTEVDAVVTMINGTIGDIITIARNQPFAQPLNLNPLGAFPSTGLEQSIDRVAMHAQVARLQGERALRFPVTDATEAGLELNKASRKSKLVGFDGNGAVQLYNPEDGLFLTGDDVEVGSVTTLRNLSLATVTAAKRVVLTGYYVRGDFGGPRVGYWDATSTTSDNGGTIFKLDSVTTGRLLFPVAGEVNIRWFGAVGDAVTDDSDAIRRSIAFAAGTAATVRIENGIFAVSFDTEFIGFQTWSKRACFHLSALSGLTIRGENATLRATGDGRDEYGHIFYARNCTGPISISGVAFDYASPAFVQGSVTEISAGDFLRVSVEWVPTFFDVQRVLFFDDDNLLQSVPVNHLSNDVSIPGRDFLNIGGGVWELDISNTSGVDLTNIVVGSRLVLVHQMYGANAVFVEHCLEAVIAGNRVYGTAGMAMAFVNTKITVADNLISPKEGSGHLISATADGIHCAACGIDGVIARNEVWSTQDDCVNAHAYVTNVITRDSGTQITIGLQNPPIEPTVGHRIDIVGANGVTQSSHVITNVAVSGSNRVLTVDGTVDAGVNSSSRVVYRTTGYNYIIKDNLLGLNRGRGILCMSINAEVSGNSIWRPSGPGILVNTFLASEYAPSENLTVNENIIERANFLDFGNKSPAALMVELLQSDGTTVMASGAFRRAAITGNEIVDTNNGAIFISGILGSIVAFNTSRNIGVSPQDIYGITGGYFLGIYNCGDVNVAFNTDLSSVVRRVSAAGTNGAISLNANRNIYFDAGTVDSLRVNTTLAGFVRALRSGSLTIWEASSEAECVSAVTAANGSNARRTYTVTGTTSVYEGLHSTGEYRLSFNSDLSSPLLTFPLRTSTAGLPAGAIWVDTADGNRLKMV